MVVEVSVAKDCSESEQAATERTEPGERTVPRPKDFGEAGVIKVEMEEEEERIKNYLDGYLKPSKRVIDLRAKEKSLVKQRDYSQA